MTNNTQTNESGYFEHNITMLTNAVNKYQSDKVYQEYDIAFTVADHATEKQSKLLEDFELTDSLIDAVFQILPDSFESRYEKVPQFGKDLLLRISLVESALIVIEINMGANAA